MCSTDDLMTTQVDEMSAPRQPSAEYADAPVPEAAAKHLQLAAAMLGRAGTQGKLTHLQLYDAVLLERLGRHAEAQPLLGSLLREHTPDAWATHAAHLRCALARTATAEGGAAAEEAAGTVGTPLGAAGTVGTPLGEARELLAKLQLEQPMLRGPWLASLVLELHARAPLAARELLGTAPGAAPGAVDAPFGGETCCQAIMQCRGACQVVDVEGATIWQRSRWRVQVAGQKERASGASGQRTNAEGMPTSGRWVGASAGG